MTPLDQFFAGLDLAAWEDGEDDATPTHCAWHITRDGERWALVGVHPPITREEAIERFGAMDARPA